MFIFQLIFINTVVHCVNYPGHAYIKLFYLSS